MSRPVLIAAAVAAAAVSVAGFTWSPAPARTSLNVPLRGRDLGVRADARSYYKDLARAAIKVCDRQPSKSTLWVLDRFDTCVKTRLGAAVAQAHAPLVTALHRQSQAYAELAAR